MLTAVDSLLLTPALFIGMSQLGVLLLLCSGQRYLQTALGLKIAIVVGVYTVAAIITNLCFGNIELILVGIAVGAFLVTLSARRLQNFSILWHLFVVNGVLETILSCILIYHIADLVKEGSNVPFLTYLGAMIVTVSLLAGRMASFVDCTAQFISLFRIVRLRPVYPRPLPAFNGEVIYPRVSLHVPCCAEPPEVVIATIDCLVRLEYPNLEILVIDNNTTDQSLWQPVEKHCATLSSVRFFHIEKLAGGKGGALNFALQETDRSAEVIGVIDSDFECEPDYLLQLVGFFDDPKLGFVQTPHDFRAFSANQFQRACYWEYRDKHALLYPGMNEWDASLITGTMCLIRRSAIETLGGWSEVCLSEDSELSVRLGAAGYSGQYVAKTFGRGLVPETFSAYKKQRFRWITGTVQQLLMHWRAFLPTPFGDPQHIAGAKRFVGFWYRAGLFTNALDLVALPIGAVVAVDCAIRAHTVAVPSALFVLIISGQFLRMGFALLRSKLMCRTTSQALLGFLADSALTHVKTFAVLRALLVHRPVAWVRTSKFRASPGLLRELAGTLSEIQIGLGSLLIASMLFFHAQFVYPDVICLLAFAFLEAALRWLSAPVMVLVGESILRSGVYATPAELTA
jgi:cellulose synthase/poly-beta-1,6-N-acetylglucosamine synthase-like glycosyltransferase